MQVQLSTCKPSIAVRDGLIYISALALLQMGLDTCSISHYKLDCDTSNQQSGHIVPHSQVRVSDIMFLLMFDLSLIVANQLITFDLD